MSPFELDPRLNRPPEKTETIHLIGVCGTAMGALAGMLQTLGFGLTGSDENVYPPMSDFLDKLGVRVFKGYSPRNLDHGPDLVVVGNVVTRQNPEVRRLKDLGLPYISFPQALKHFFFPGKKTLVAAGTHGKTTTSSLMAWILEQAGRSPGFMIGGILPNFGRNFQVGQGEWFVVEGDEYDTAFFDKVPKFIHYQPFLGLLTSVEFDHADIYEDLEAVRGAFRRFVDLIPPDGLLAAWGDSPEVKALAGRCRAPVTTYGFNPENDWRAENLDFQGRRTGFDLVRPGRDQVRLFSPLPGEHNVLNTLGAAILLDRAGLSLAEIRSGLETFQGVRRRQEVRGRVDGVTVIDDFAHHPTAVRATVRAVRRAYPGLKLTAVFEPRTNTSRRGVFQKDYALAFDQADEVLIREAPALEKAPPDDRFSSRRLVEDLTGRGLKASYFRDTDSLARALLDGLGHDDLVLIMSNGGFDGLHQRLLEALEARRSGAGGQGGGSPN